MKAQTDIIVQMFSEFRESVGQQLVGLKEDIREDGKRRDQIAFTNDTANKAEFVSLKQLLLDVQKLISTLPSREDYNRLDARLVKVEGIQQSKLPVFDDIATRLTKAEGTIGTLMTERAQIQGGWWMVLKVTAVVMAICGAAAWFYEQFTKF